MPIVNICKRAKSIPISQDSVQSVFKVIFVGDSNVGKTTIIKHYALGEYSPMTAATVGVDYQIKTVQFDDNKAVLQLWDTAGQEKFRSITKQYFRKADGVVVVFDMTSVESFLHIRNWMECLHESAPENRTVMVLGNKKDLIEGMEPGSYVTVDQGLKMAAVSFSNPTLFLSNTHKFQGGCIQNFQGRFIFKQPAYS
ncbi:ADP-ribosylation factor [Cichlidogyrus casuarinus]|uniref:ADP-ribosylation factor n=1 Tax=Cichlidogyrus casuarinus TaxID=1844966 RepID=A0ABD2PW52_9PLAT